MSSSRQRVVLAPDKFKGSLTALQVAQALSLGLTSVLPDLDVVLAPVADGGDGTVAAALSSGYTEIVVDAEGPTGEVGPTAYALAGTQAVVELAAVVGLDRLPGGVLAPRTASTYGLGQVLLDAVGRGATDIVLGVGGSASTDGGAGMIQALGGRLLDAGGAELARGGAALTDLATLDLTAVRAALGPARITVATDVDNPLLGPNGAAAIFGPQKGADPDEVSELEAGLKNWARVVARTTGRDVTDRPGVGAAGGTAYGAVAVLGATIRPGIELILELLDFEETVAGADLVITGEGSLDEQSLAGKAPIGVARAGTRAGVRVIAVAGRNLLSDRRLSRVGIAAAYALADVEPDLARSMTNAAPLLGDLGARIAREWLV